MKRLLTKLIVQPVWVEIDDDDNATELVSQPEALKPKEIQNYVDQLSAIAEQMKQGIPPGDHNERR
jgi:hypothetical protein